jgi:hypothetical protein
VWIVKLNTLRIRVARILIFGLVQFSRSTEAHPRVLRGWSLKTEQRFSTSKLVA